MTSYRREETHAETAARSKSASHTRGRLVGAVESSVLIRGFRAVFGGLFDCPTACYGVFGILYGLFSILFTRIGFHAWVRDRGSLIFSVLAAVLSIPLLFSKRSLSESLGYSTVVRRLLVGFLGIPRDRLTHIVRRYPPHRKPLAMLLAGVLGICASVASLVISSWIIPLIFLAVSLLGMIIAYPETGVVLFTLMLPLLWLDNRNVVAVVCSWYEVGFM